LISLAGTARLRAPVLHRYAAPMNTTATLHTTRTIPAPPDRVYAAFANGEELAQWWGPNGFRNEFDAFDFQPGGEWVFTMVGPDGTRYPNRNRFADLVPGQRVVVLHESAPHFRLTVQLTPTAQGTHVDWNQAFEDAAVANAVRHIAEPGNEQNLDRLAALLDRAAG
jgi:uncharacterized protein YndB with AHSA1/START domain